MDLSCPVRIVVGAIGDRLGVALEVADDRWRWRSTWFGRFTRQSSLPGSFEGEVSA